MNAMERASHPSRAQVEALLEFLQRNPSLAKGFTRVPSARDAARRSWEALALQLNSLGGCVKTSKQWIKEHHHLSTPSTLSDTVVSTGISHRVVAPSPPHTPPRVIGPASPPLPPTPSGSGAHPLQHNVDRRSSRSPIIGPSPIITPTNRRSRRRQAVAPPSQRQSQFSRMTERFLAIEEQRMEVDRRNLLLREAIVNHTRERDNATTQALLAIGEGLKLLAEAIKK